MKTNKKGNNTIGYGGTKRAVMEADKLGLTIAQASKKYGLSETAVRCAAIRNGIRLKSFSGRPPHGLVKNSVIQALAQNPRPTITQVCKKHGIKRTSVIRMLHDFREKLLP